jgi:hypothetical protein
MTKTARPIPAGLARVGITHVVDNVPEGSYIGGFEADFVRLFRNDIIKKLFKTGGKNAQSIESVSAVSGLESDSPRADTRGSARRVSGMRAGQKQTAIRGSTVDQGVRAGNKKRG